MIRMKDIAEKVGVSRATVSIVLNQRPLAARLSPEVRRRIIAEAAAMGYYTNELARAVASGHAKVIGFVNYGLGHEFWGRIFDGMSAAADNRGYYIKHINIDGHQDQEPAETASLILRKCLEQRMTGMLSCSGEVHLTRHLSTTLKTYGIPLGVVDYPGKNHGLIKVISDDASGCDQMMDYLAKAGFTRAAYVAHGYPEFPFERIRTKAFTAAAKRLGLEFAKRYQLITADSETVQVDAVKELLTRPGLPNVIVCSTDMNAYRVLQAATNLGLRVPDDLSVTGFGDISFSKYSAPPLTTIDQKFERMGETVARKILDLIEGTGGTATGDFLIPTELVVRDSVNGPIASSSTSAHTRKP